MIKTPYLGQGQPIFPNPNVMNLTKETPEPTDPSVMKTIAYMGQHLNPEMYSYTHLAQ